jgi:multicomponent Na+:H+ antiporter subunit C
MEIVLAVVIGVLYAAGIYMLLRRSLVKLLIGLSLMSHAANLLIFTVARLTRAQAPVLAEGAAAASGPMADPVPQSLVLTAIVIGFAVTAFALALSFRVYRTVGTDDLDRMQLSDV